MRRRSAGVGFGQYRQTVAVNAVRDPGFSAVKHIVGAIFFGCQTDTL